MLPKTLLARLSLAVCVLGLGALAFVLLFGSRVLPGGALITTGQAAIGGPFSLVDHTGRRVTDETFKGRYSLIYFGFTSCPDICPTELQVMARALDLAGADVLDDVQPIFITVDPERDTVEAVASYVGLFHPKLLGLTGSASDVRGATRAYRVFANRVDLENSDGDYTMDHSSITYLMDREGQYLAHFNYGVGPEQMAQRLISLVK